ncbi:MAG: tyrosine-type recombinase/integrase [Nitrososphaerota archaeon]|nr:tyrosine-type recombinase/integrase [Nitrososphaerota archaeon]
MKTGVLPDIHSYEKRLQLCVSRIENDSFSSVDKLLIKNYLKHAEAQGVSKGRVFKIAWTLLTLRRHLRCNFREADRGVIEGLMAWLNGTDFSANTKSDHKKILKRFYKYVRSGNADKDTPFPKEVSWIDTSIKKNEQVEPDVITEEEAKRMIDGATSARDRALVAVLFEGGFRVGEALGMRVSDVVFDENGAKVSVRGKTGSRTVRLITSAPLLGLYVQQHPFKGGDGPLWIHFGTWKKYQRMSYQATRETLIRIAERAGIRKRVHPHLFRHSAATRDGGYNISERILELKFGWAKGSKMAARYTHLRDERIADNVFLSTYAGKETKPPEPEFRPLQCPKCSEKNTPGMRYCGRCGCPLEGPELSTRNAEIETLRSQVSEIKSLLERVLSRDQR